MLSLTKLPLNVGVVWRCQGVGRAMEALQSEIAELRALVLDQQQRLAELEQASARKGAAGGDADVRPTRRGMLFGAAAALGAAASFGVEQAQAADGSPLLCGRENTATSPTKLRTGNGQPASGPAFMVTDVQRDIQFKTTIAAFSREAARTPLYGLDDSPEGGLTALAVSSFGTGMFGLGWEGTGVLGYGVVGVHGYTGGGIGVLAQGTEADGETALVVDGTLRAKRVGVSVIRVGRRHKTVHFPVSDTSFVFATPQATTGTIAVSGVTVNATASPPRFTISLSSAAPSGGLRVAWLVVDEIGSALEVTRDRLDLSALSRSDAAKMRPPRRGQRRSGTR